MKANFFARILLLSFLGILSSACGREAPVDIKAITSSPKTYVGSDTCKKCHLEHYDSWQMTLHSRMTQDPTKNRDVIIAPFDKENIRQDLAKLGDELKVPADQVYIPNIEDIKIAIGTQWKQRYVVEKDGSLYIAPIEYDAETHRWSSYHEDDWDKRTWLSNCGGCHATGVDLKNKTYTELGVSCEACHGKGSWHAALPKTAVFEKRQTIINPAKLTMGVAVQICGSCHAHGMAVQDKNAGWAVGYEPGKALDPYYNTPDFKPGDIKEVYAEEFSKGHHQQFTDWKMSQHFKEGVTCTSCHYVHQIGLPPTRSQTIGAGSQQCFECHQILNKTSGHAIHSFANCIGCHMPKVVASDESGITHSHAFVALLPIDTIKNPKVPNSCQACHEHKDANPKDLQEKAFPGSLGGW